MATITTRAGKGSPLTNSELDANFTNLNSDKIELTDLSVGSEGTASGDGSITYSNSTGVFTYTPPDLSSYLTAESDTLDSVTGRGNTTTNDITVGNIITDQVQLTGGSGTQGTVSWNTDEETLDLILDGATLQLGQEVHYHVRNNSGSTISNGTPVMVTGTIGNSGRLTVSPMDATDPDNDMYYIGVATEDIANDTDGKVTHFGKVRGIDTSSYTDGDILWLSTSTAGAFTTTEPSSGIKVPAAIVIHAHSNGTLFVRFQGSYGLHDMHDVTITTPADNELLAYDSTSSLWINQTPAEAGFATVATSGAYSDLSGAPTNVSAFTNDAGYLTTETNDLTASVTWANVPDANITESSVTQHQAALSLTQSQITDLTVGASLDDATALAIALG